MLTLSITGPVATITLSPPGKLNAIARDQWGELADLVREADGSAARMLVLRSSEPGVFCAGADIAEFEELQTDEEARTRFRLAMREGIEALADHPLPTIALVEGNCIGAAVALVLACDIRIAGKDARFAVTPAKLGLTYQVDDCARLAATVGQGQAARLIFSASTIDADEAARIGLVELTGGEDALEDLTNSISANSGQSIAALKALLKAAMAGESGSHTEELFDEAFGSSDFAEGLKAFRERRRPKFS